MQSGFGLIDIIIMVLVGVFIFTRFFGYKLPKKTKRRTRKGTTNILEFSIGAAPQAKPKPRAKKKPPATGAAALQAIDPSFTEKDFLKGATAAFSMYYQAYAEADEETLENLLSPRLYDQTMDELESKPAAVKAELVNKPQIMDARVNGQTMVVDVKYEAKITKGKAAAKPTAIIWTWARPANTDDPNWELDAISYLA